jgi:hypothetical protein
MRRRAADALYSKMLNALNFCLHGELSMVKIAQVVESVAARKDVRVDRLARRTKDGLICWLCENAPELALGGEGTLESAQRRSTAPAPPPPQRAAIFDWIDVSCDARLLREEEMLIWREGM